MKVDNFHKMKKYLERPKPAFTKEEADKIDQDYHEASDNKFAELNVKNKIQISQNIFFFI